MDVENQGRNMLILFDAGSRFRRKVFVISAPVDLKDTAESFDAVLETEFVYGI